MHTAHGVHLLLTHAGSVGVVPQVFGARGAAAVRRALVKAGAAGTHGRVGARDVHVVAAGAAARAATWPLLAHAGQRIGVH